MKILIITNDSTVFLHRISIAKDMFGGRVTEVRRFSERLSEHHDVTFCIISGEYGLVLENEIIEEYDRVTDNASAYRELQHRMDFITSLNDMSGSFDFVLLFVPKEMMRMILEKGNIECSVIAVTSLEFRDEFDRRGWTFHERRGARIGRKNAETIINELSCACPL